MDWYEMKQQVEKDERDWSKWGHQGFKELYEDIIVNAAPPSPDKRYASR